MLRKTPLVNLGAAPTHALQLAVWYSRLARWRIAWGAVRVKNKAHTVRRKSGSNSR
jgi:hypothetical protein